ncbi:MAG: hypothetical protein ABIA76_05215 [Candidatus Diapherotrites archaeon]
MKAQKKPLQKKSLQEEKHGFDFFTRVKKDRDILNVSEFSRLNPNVNLDYFHLKALIPEVDLMHDINIINEKAEHNLEFRRKVHEFAEECWKAKSHELNEMMQKEEKEFDLIKSSYDAGLDNKLISNDFRAAGMDRLAGEFHWKKAVLNYVFLKKYMIH